MTGTIIYEVSEGLNGGVTDFETIFKAVFKNIIEK
jgi:hypothetical protein